MLCNLSCCAMLKASWKQKRTFGFHLTHFGTISHFIPLEATKTRKLSGVFGGYKTEKLARNRSIRFAFYWINFTLLHNKSTRNVKLQFLLRGHLCSTYAKFSENLIFLTPSPPPSLPLASPPPDTCTCVWVSGGKEMLVSRKILGNLYTIMGYELGEEYWIVKWEYWFSYVFFVFPIKALAN